MKKQLLLAFAGLSLLTTTQLQAQNKAAGIQSQAASQPQRGTSLLNARQPSAVISTTTSSCMSINLPTPASWTLSNYGTGNPFAANGFVNGKNSYGDKEKAMYFDVSATANTLITQVYVGFGIAYSATPTKTVAVKIYDGTTGTPGTALGTATISMATIMSDVSSGQYSLLIFGTPISLPASKKFFASVDVTGLQWTSTIHDSLSIVSNTDPQSSPTQAWEKWSTNAWYNYSNVNSWGLSISLLIHPFLTQAPLSAVITPTSSIACTGQSINYNSAGSTTGGSYQWVLNGASTTTASGATTSATYPAAGSYTTYLIVSDACGSLKLAQSTLTINTTPTITATPASTAACIGASVSLSGGGASTYTWSGGISNATPFAVSATTNYTVTGTAANGCTSTAVALVTANANPTVTANTSTSTVCSGGNVTLNGGGASTYAWTGGVTDGVSFVPSGTNTYTVTGTAANSCTSTAIITVTVTPNPTVSATPASTTVCSGASVTFSGGGASTYAWTGGISDGVAFNAVGTTTYTVTGTAVNGCTATATAILNVNPSPTVTAAATPTAACAGGSVTLNGGGATTYTWSGGVTDGLAFVPASSGTYVVTGTSGSCTGSATISVAVNANPGVTANTTATMVCTGQSITLTGGGATTYTWSGGVTDAMAFVPASSNTYTVTGTDANGCTNTATVGITVSACTGINAIAGTNISFGIYPNPANGAFTVSAPVMGLFVEIYDNTGKLALREAIALEKQQINADLPSGIYLVKLSDNDHKVMFTQKLIRQ